MVFLTLCFLSSSTQGKIVAARGPTKFGTSLLSVVHCILYLTAVNCIGWDPIFEYQGQTYAEMDKVEKVKT